MKKYQITVNGNRYEVEVELLEDDSHLVNPTMPMPMPEISHAPAHESHDSYHHSEHRFVRPFAGSKELTCPINGTIISILVGPGATVREKDVVATIEAMKMKTSVFSNQSGVVKSIDVKIGDIVDHGQKILTFE